MNTPIAESVPAHAPKSAVEMRTITDDEAGQRIDNFLMRHFKTVPRSRVYRLVRKGEVRVNRKRVDVEYKLAAGDEIRLPPVRIEEGGEPGQPSHSLLELIEKSIIFHDKHVLVLDKPAGVAVHGGSGMSFGVIEALRASRPRETLELVHRLDRDTSGCLLIARDRATLVSLHALIRGGGIHKTYLALVSGSWQLGTKRIDAPLATDNREHGERHVRVAESGKNSVSVFKPVQFFGSLATLMQVDIPTGRTHQIRVHASFAGHPLLGDDKYGDFERNAELKRHGLKRTFLHAQSVEFEWPGSGVPFHVSAPLPPELSSVIDEITVMKRKTPKGAVRARARPARAGAKASRPSERAPRRDASLERGPSSAAAAPRAARPTPRAAPRPARAASTSHASAPLRPVARVSAGAGEAVRSAGWAPRPGARRPALRPPPIAAGGARATRAAPRPAPGTGGRSGRGVPRAPGGASRAAGGAPRSGRGAAHAPGTGGRSGRGVPRAPGSARTGGGARPMGGARAGGSGRTGAGRSGGGQRTEGGRAGGGTRAGGGARTKKRPAR